MNYKIKEVSELSGLSPSTLRYYEKEKLLSSVKRNEAGIRIYDEQDLDTIAIITCLKSTDMPIQDIGKFLSLSALGDETLEERRRLIIEHKRSVENRIKELERYMEHINYKVDYYNEACESGTERFLKEREAASNMFDHPCLQS